MLELGDFSALIFCRTSPSAHAEQRRSMSVATEHPVPLKKYRTSCCTYSAHSLCATESSESAEQNSPRSPSPERTASRQADPREEVVTGANLRQAPAPVVAAILPQ